MIGYPVLISTLQCFQDPKLLAALQESRERQAPYAGAFLLKDEPEADPSVVSGSDTDKNVYDLKGKDLFNRLHEVGTLAQVCDLVSSWLSSFMPSVDCLYNFFKYQTFFYYSLFSITDFKYSWGSGDPDWSPPSTHNRDGQLNMLKLKISV